MPLLLMRHLRPLHQSAHARAEFSTANLRQGIARMVDPVPAAVLAEHNCIVVSDGYAEVSLRTA